ncbi:MAG: permease [Bacillota bacterium]
MTLSIIIFSALAIVLFFINLKNGKHRDGLQAGFRQLLAALPVILLAMLLAGILETLIPEEFIKRWLAQEAGLTGIFLGTLGGLLMAFGPYASYPIIAIIYHAGAGLGTTIALMAGWSFLNLTKLPFESGFLGYKFSLLRMGLGLPLCIIAGLIAHFIEKLL